jgi:hypothetical protein
MNKAKSPRRCAEHYWPRFLLAMLLAGPVLFAGCAAEDKKPKTVSEFLKQPRVGEIPR